MARRTANVILDPMSRPELVTWKGNRYLALKRGTINGERVVFLVGGTSWSVPESEVTVAMNADDYSEANRAAIAAYRAK